jgi:hypothetical protein
VLFLTDKPNMGFPEALKRNIDWLIEAVNG